MPALQVRKKVRSREKGTYIATFYYVICEKCGWRWRTRSNNVPMQCRHNTCTAWQPVTEVIRIGDPDYELKKIEFLEKFHAPTQKSLDIVP